MKNRGKNIPDDLKKIYMQFPMPSEGFYQLKGI